MDWLRAILEKATVTDGALNVDDLLKQVSAEFPKHAVPKADFNVKVQELSTANKTIADLKKRTAIIRSCRRRLLAMKQKSLN